LSHGYQTPTKKISAVSIYFECLPYRLDESTGLIDYDTLEKNSKLYRPKLLVTGASAYPRHIDYARMRSIANGVNALLMVDMAHISGLVAAGVMPSPFEYADIVTTTTHKSLRGPRGAMIFYRKGVRSTDKAGKVTRYELEDKINAAVFPGHQGGPHNHTITALAVALKQAQSEDYKAYQKLVLSNNKVLADSLVKKGYTLVSGGTDNHLILVDLRPLKLNGAKVERILELVCVALNKNTVPGDVSALSPGGVRLGTPALTSRGFDGAAFEQVADFFHRGVQIALKVQEKSGTKAAEFKAALDAAAKDGFNSLPELQQLRKDVQTYARTFPPIGFTLDSMKYKN
jgi:glycine hydroxymethyltransferase